MAYTLAQFERIDGLLNAVLRRPALEDVIPLGREVATERYFRPEWMLEDALVEVLGLERVHSFAGVEECGADFVTRCLLSADLVEAV